MRHHLKHLTENYSLDHKLSFLGASACLELDHIEEAFTWLKKGIKVSYTYDYLVT